jgi:hypothetical protein
MVVYRTKKKRTFKWILAAVIFIIAMCVAFSDVSGSVLPI